MDARPPAARRQRPGERVRRRHARADPPQGRGAHPGQRLLVRAARRTSSRRTTSRRDTDEILARGAGARRPARTRSPAARCWCAGPTPVPFECVVRGYLSGSAWAEYRQRGTLAGEPLPAGLRESDRLEPPLFSPATKAETGHDENVTVRPRWPTALGARAGRPAARRELRRLPRRPRSRRVARDHHRRHQVRVRHRRRRHAAA